MREFKITTIVLFISISCAYSQFYQGLYNLKSIGLTRLLDPAAQIINNEEVILPFLLNFSVSAELYGIKTQSLIDSRMNIDQFFVNNNKNLTGKEHLWLNQSINLFFVAFPNRAKNIYYSMGFYQDAYSFSQYPKGFVSFMNSRNDLVAQKFTMDKLNFEGAFYTTYHFGMTFLPENRLYSIGFRAKVYNSLANYSTANSAAVIHKTPNGNSYNLDLIGELRMNYGGLFGVENPSNRQMIRDFFWSGDMGLGLDIGFDYQFANNWDLSASIIDFGAIYNQNNSNNLVLNSNYRTDEYLDDSQANTNNPFQGAINNLKEGVNFGKFNHPYLIQLPTKLFVSAKYHLPNKYYFKTISKKDCPCDSYLKKIYEHSISITSYNRFVNRYWDWALGVSYFGNYHNTFGFQLNYLVSPDDYVNFGLGFSIKVKKLLIYTNIDNIVGLFNPVKTNSLGVQFGMSLVL